MPSKIKDALRYLCCFSNPARVPDTSAKEGKLDGKTVRHTMHPSASEGAFSNTGEVYLGGEIDPALYRVLDRATPQGNS